MRLNIRAPLEPRATVVRVGGARLWFAIAGSVAIVTAIAAAPATSGSEGAAGTLTLNASLRLSSLIGGCPPPAGADECAARTIEGAFPGLGQVTGRYEFYVDLGPPTCAEGRTGVLAYPIRFAVAGKGEIHVAVAEAQCRLSSEPIFNQTQTFTVTGGTGIYAGASGGGTLERRLGDPTASGPRVGRETWTGALAVPGLEFDLTPPTVNGAVAKTVRAPRGVKRVRVAYVVTALDDVDGAVPVSCQPRSGSRFRIGRTVVTCSAGDTSANTRTAKFSITVRARR